MKTKPTRGRMTVYQEDGVPSEEGIPLKAGGMFVAYANRHVSSFGNKKAEANAARIAVCWNACLKLPDPAVVPELVEVLAGLFEHCAMVHKHWGENSNQREADAAQRTARAVLKRCKP